MSVYLPYIYMYTCMYVCIYKTCPSPKVKLSSLSDPTDPTSPPIGTQVYRYTYKNSITKPPVPCQPKKKTDFSLSFYVTYTCRRLGPLGTCSRLPIYRATINKHACGLSTLGTNKRLLSKSRTCAMEFLCLKEKLTALLLT